jgi:hypothetical protein
MLSSPKPDASTCCSRSILIGGAIERALFRARLRQMSLIKCELELRDSDMPSLQWHNHIIESLALASIYDCYKLSHNA